MINKRIISTFLVVLMLFSALAVTIGAAENTSATAQPEYEYNTSKYTPTMDYLTGKYERKDENGDVIETIIVDTQEEKLEIMDFRLEYQGYRLYVDAYSGEVAVENTVTGDVLFTNPYDAGTTSSTDDVKAEMLSQLIITYADTTDTTVDAQPAYNTYKHAVKGNGEYTDNTISQIDVKYIQNGIRVEYSIGRIDSRYLVPKAMLKEDFEEKILNVINANEDIDEWDKNMKLKFFKLRDIDAYLENFKEEDQEKQRDVFLKMYPWAEKGVFYEFTGVTKSEYKSMEDFIKTYCPDFTFEDLDEAHLELEVPVSDMNEPLFKISLEYTLDGNGLNVRIPANGIRFDESIYRLEDIEILPYMGAGKNPNSGYTFFPDGSGALFDFEQLAKISGDTYFHGVLYGHDFAYSSINTTMPHNQIVRYPVFGLVETQTLADGKERSRGFVAIVEEGDSLMTLSAHHSSTYNTVRMTVSPRPFDEYKLSDAISVAGDTPFIVVSPRKYTGDFKIKYQMLTDPDVKTGKGYYDTSYVGMAKAYREYLIANGTLTKLTDKDVKKDIPLYIETFGAMETTEKFLSIPYTTMKPLTSFSDLKKMYDELAKSGISNINFILTGYADGGLTADAMPEEIDWDSVVEEDMDFEELIEYAKKKGFGIYPDFDFAFVADNDLFDGLTLSDHAVKTIDDRYTSKREYSASRQAYVNYFELAMSPAYFSKFYEDLTEDYTEYKPIGISVSTLGSFLTSDFDEDEPYHREDSKGFIVDAFKYLDEHYNKVMTSGGNSYTWKYVDYITDISIDSSRHSRSAATVPFLGIVLHGYVETAGTPINMEGNISYAMLRAIENGSALQFVLSYRNTALLKENEQTSQYYSVRYDIWVDDVIAHYLEINEALKDVQTSTIEVHKFIEGLRVPNANEIAGDASQELFDAIYNNIKETAANKEELRDTIQNVRKYLLEWEKYVAPEFETAKKIYATKDAKLEAFKAAETAFEAAKVALAEAEAALAAAEKTVADAVAAAQEALDAANTALAEAEEGADTAALEAAVEAAKKALEDAKLADYETVAAAQSALEAAKTAYDTAKADMFDKYYDYKNTVASAEELAAKFITMYKEARDNFAKLEQEENNAYTPDIVASLKTILETVAPAYDELVALADEMENAVEDDAVLAFEEKYAEEIGIDVEEEEKEENTTTKNTYNKYSVPANSIVYEEYSNGKAFILNFNNYSVKVELNGTYYVIEAYGYVIIN